MNDSKLPKSILISISDPWDLGEILKWQPLIGKVIARSHSAILVKLDVPIKYKNTDCEFFVVSPRLEGTNISQLFEGSAVFCGITRISPELASSNNPFDLSSWRGGVGIIGDVRLI